MLSKWRGKPRSAALCHQQLLLCWVSMRSVRCFGYSTEYLAVSGIFPHFQQLNLPEIQQKSTRYFSNGTTTWNNSFRCCGKLFLFLCQMYMREETWSHHTPTQDPQHVSMPQLLSGNCSFCWDLSAVQAQHTVWSHSFYQMWQMCSFLLYS